MRIYSLLITASVVICGPFSLQWNTESIGGDGPWNSILVQVAGQEVAVYGVRQWDSWFPTEDYCNGSIKLQYTSTLRDGCYPAKAGVLTRDDDTLPTDNISWPLRASGMSAGQSMGNEQDLIRSAPELDIGNGQQSWQVIQYADTGLATAQTLEMANGVGYPPAAGCLAVGAKDGTERTFTGGDYTRYYPAGDLYNRKHIDSYTYGMHIGSVAPKGSMTGSFVVGGYDKNRVVGEVFSYTDDSVTLQDISIDVISGDSPLGTSGNITGLLASGNTTMPGTIPVTISGCAPFLTLPESTCNAIAAQLPVEPMDELGIYFWNTSSPVYKNLINSATTLSFTLMASSNTDSITIRVPFMHLNLTLDQPFIESPRPYFPCYGKSRTGEYNLGRALLQDAFIGTNYLDGSYVNWIAQAPGPFIPINSDVQSISSTQTTITSSDNDWVSSWSRAWTPYNASADPTSTPDSSGSSSNTSSKKASSNAGAIAGGVVGGVAGVALIAGLIFFFLRRRRNENPASEKTEIFKPSESQGTPELADTTGPSSPYRDTPLSTTSHQPSELGGSAQYTALSNQAPAELGTNAKQDPVEMAA